MHAALRLRFWQDLSVPKIPEEVRELTEDMLRYGGLRQRVIATHATHG